MVGRSAYKVLLVDDHALFRAGLRLLLNTVNQALTIFEAATLAEAQVLVEDHPDLRLCLLDLSLKHKHGLLALGELRSVAPNVSFVVVSATEDSRTVHACLDAGAMSFIPKSASPSVLMDALREVLDGRIYLPAYIGSDTSSEAALRPVLTPRQRDVLRALCHGLPTKSIAKELLLSEYTVREHIATIFRILGVHNRTDAVIQSSRRRFWSDG